MSGRLFVIATPIGNLEDLSPRARAALRDVACIACEDTRRTAKLLARFEIATRTVACHKFNEAAQIAPVIALLREGRDVALVSDGGTPGIADPGALLVREVQREGIDVVPIPGPSAIAALLSASGIPADRFVFDGFLPHREGERRRRLRELAGETRPVVVYESPHRIQRTLADVAAILGERPIVLGRELTKIHETILRGTAASLLLALGDGEVQGEIALVIEGAPPDGAPRADGAAEALRRAWETALAGSGGDRRRALRAAARATGLERAALYRRLAELGIDPSTD